MALVIVAAPSVPPEKVAVAALLVAPVTLSNSSGTLPASEIEMRLVPAAEPAARVAESVLPVVPV